MTSQTLTRGQNIALPAGDVITIDVDGSNVDLVAFQLGPGKSVRGDGDFVFYNQPQSPERAVSLTGAACIEITLAAVPADIERIAVAVTSEFPLGTTALTATLTIGADTVIVPAQGLSTEQAAILVEVYRRHGAWKVRSESAGWDEGFAALVRALGVTVDDGPTAHSVAPAATSPQVRIASGEDALSPDKRRTLHLRKEKVHTVLLTKGAAGCTARVVLVIDKTLSMTSLYRDGTVARVVERMIPIATQLDSDGNLEAYLYGEHYAQLPDVTVANSEQWIDTLVHLHGTHGEPLCAPIDYDTQIGGFNQELPIMNAILNDLRDTQPVLVLFFTDGGFSTKGPIKRLITAAAGKPAFWQFVGLGDNNFGVLTELDSMAGRVVDNAGFFQMFDVDRSSDTDLYTQLLGEFPDWMRAAAAHNIIDARYTAPTR